MVSEEGLWRVCMKLYEDIINKADIRMPTCKYCGSKDVVKNGHRKGVQYWLCKKCGHGFVNNQGIPKSRYPIDTVARALYNYYAGMSLNAICEGIRQATGESITDSSVYNWLAKYTRIALDEAEKHQPQVGKKWVMDETVLKLGGKKWWLITAIDYDTRFLLGTKLSTNRNHKDIQEVLEEATRKTGTIPTEVLTDGWGGYRDGIELAYGADAKHIVTTPFTDAELSSNLMERWNGTLKDRLKPMRGMDRNTKFQLILDGFLFYYNYLRPHMGIGGKTPAQAAMTGYPFENWRDVVESQMPRLEVPDDAEVEYRLRRKPTKKRVGKKARRTGNKPQTTLGRMKR